MTLTKEQTKAALEIYIDNLIANYTKTELVDMLIKQMPTKDLDDEIQTIVDLCDVEPDGTY